MITYERGLRFFWKRIFQCRGSVFPKSMCIGLACAGATAGLKVLIDEGYMASLSEDGSKSVLRDNSAWSGFVFLVGFLTVFRTSQAYARFWDGASAMTRMRAEWFDSCAALISFCKYSAASSEETLRFQHILVRLFSMLHAVALAGIEDHANKINKGAFFHYELLDASALDEQTLKIVKESDAKPELVFQWVQQLIVENIDNKVLKIPPPILSRSFQEIANGMAAFADAMKITSMPFPFPYTQTCECLLLLHWLCTPLVVSQYVSTPWWGALFSFLQVFVYWSLNTIAVEIENPFGCDANDIDTANMQREMNRNLLQMIDVETKRTPTLNPEVDLTTDVTVRKKTTTRWPRENETLRQTITTSQFALFDVDSEDSIQGCCSRLCSYLKRGDESSGQAGAVGRIETLQQAAMASRGPILPHRSNGSQNTGSPTATEIVSKRATGSSVSMPSEEVRVQDRDPSTPWSEPAALQPATDTTDAGAGNGCFQQAPPSGEVFREHAPAAVECFQIPSIASGGKCGEQLPSAGERTRTPSACGDQAPASSECSRTPGSLGRQISGHGRSGRASATPECQVSGHSGSGHALAAAQRSCMPGSMGRELSSHRGSGHAPAAPERGQTSGTSLGHNFSGMGSERPQQLQPGEIARMSVEGAALSERSPSPEASRQNPMTQPQADQAPVYSVIPTNSSVDADTPKAQMQSRAEGDWVTCLTHVSPSAKPSARGGEYIGAPHSEQHPYASAPLAQNFYSIQRL